MHIGGSLLFDVVLHYFTTKKQGNPPQYKKKTQKNVPIYNISIFFSLKHFVKLWREKVPAVFWERFRENFYLMFVFLITFTDLKVIEEFQNREIA